MARKVTPEDIKQINELYYCIKNYAEVARQTGWSASTIKKYVQINYVPEVQVKKIEFDVKDLLWSNVVDMLSGKKFEDVCELSEDEKEELRDLWKELLV